MATLSVTSPQRSVLGGAMIIGGTIIGAGMFSLPVVMSGAWFFWSVAALIFTWFCMLHSGLMILEANLNYHIGASSLIYVLVSFIFFKGIQTKYYRLVALSLAVILVYGGMVWYIFPKVDDKISWEGHLAGLITGFVLSLFYKTSEYKKIIKYDWEHPDFNPMEDKFMQRFDENGNFVNKPVEEETEDYFTTNENSTYKFKESN